MSRGASVSGTDEVLREAGVRSLEREVATVCRKVTRAFAEVEAQGFAML